ncbi:MAG: RluA family pseudouridine synthase [Proteobacteria bacterium]|nr:RluA family pseudouridine synthase [Pseudomonadota bacterium]
MTQTANLFVRPEDIRGLGPAINAGCSGESLLAWVQKKYPFLSPLSWKQHIEAGKVTINEQVEWNVDRALAPGDRLGRVHLISDEPPVDTNLTVLWSDNDIAVISKPAGLPMHEAGFFRRKTVSWLLKPLLGENWAAVHRLDRETSGLVLCGRGGDTRRILAEGFRHNLIEKAYLAVCVGHSSRTRWTDTRPILQASSSRERATCLKIPVAGSVSAETHFELMSTDFNRSTVVALPKTGRTHQIRVHLGTAGLPIVGDKVYGSDPDVYARYLSEGNTLCVQKLAGHSHHLLHAWKLKFQVPGYQSLVEITAKPSSDFSI